MKLCLPFPFTPSTMDDINQSMTSSFLSSLEFDLEDTFDMQYTEPAAAAATIPATSAATSTRQAIPSPLAESLMTSSNKYAGRLLPFPLRLMHMLNDVEKRGMQEIVSWMPCGRMFKVHNPTQFVKEVAPVYFNLTQFKSFKRQLLNYGFVRVEVNPRTTGAFHHPQFLRDDPTKCRFIVRGVKKNRIANNSENGLSSSMASLMAAREACHIPAMSPVDEIAHANTTFSAPSHHPALESQSMADMSFLASNFASFSERTASIPAEAREESKMHGSPATMPQQHLLSSISGRQSQNSNHDFQLYTDDSLNVNMPHSSVGIANPSSSTLRGDDSSRLRTMEWLQSEVSLPDLSNVLKSYFRPRGTPSSAMSSDSQQNNNNNNNNPSHGSVMPYEDEIISLFGTSTM